MITRLIAAIILSYGLGCFNTGYYYIRLLYKKDIREVGTNATGAMNVSRLAGKRGFFFTFIGDAFKGALVVLLARGLVIGQRGILLCILAVLLGHIFPIQLNFHGGKGISTLFGALLFDQPTIILMLFLTCLVVYPFVRRFTITSLCALFLLPLELFLTDYSPLFVFFGAAYSTLVIYACRSNVREYFREKAYHKS